MVRRRKRTIAAAALIVPLVAVLLSMRQEPFYEASAKVLLTRQNLAASLSGIQDPNLFLQADRVAQTQADLARVPEVANRVVQEIGREDITASDLLAFSSVQASTNADLLEFRVRNRDPALAARLATAYAQQFTIYRRELDTGALVRARKEVQSRINELAAKGDRGSALYVSLLDKEQQLRTMEALQTSNTLVVNKPTGAQHVGPTPVRNGVLGFALGIVLGVGLAFVIEALDTRARSSEEISERLELPVLARIPEPRVQLQRTNTLVMLAEPNAALAEAFRVFRTNLEFVTLDREIRTIMVTSAVEGEGKTTTISNLAVALARAGRRVVLVDLDLRRPSLQRFFNIKGTPGFTDVALGHVKLERAITQIVIPAPGENLKVGGRRRDGVTDEGAIRIRRQLALVESVVARSSMDMPSDPGAKATVPADPVAKPDAETEALSSVPAGSTEPGWEARNGRNDRSDVPVALEVVPSGTIPPNPGEFVGTRAVAEVVETLKQRADVVLIDVPPLLRVGDSLALSSIVDGLVLVAHFDHTRRPMLGELRRALESCRAAKLGLVLTGSEPKAGYSYGGEYYQPSFGGERTTVD